MDNTKNKAIDTHNILCEQLENLSDLALTGDKLKETVKRAETICKVAAQITSNGNLVLRAMELGLGEKEMPAMLNGKPKPFQIPEHLKGK